jgi:hypothetical protein
MNPGSPLIPALRIRGSDAEFEIIEVRCPSSSVPTAETG